MESAPSQRTHMPELLPGGRPGLTARFGRPGSLESVITALIGAALGLPLGIFLALLATQALEALQYE